ncbi:MAG: marine proteobacterial sortase target protein [Burkholderiaceae bacterium]
MAQAEISPTSGPCVAIDSSQTHWQGWLLLLLKSVAFALAISLSLMILVALTAATAMAQQNQGERNSQTHTIPRTNPATRVVQGLQGLPRGAEIADGAVLMFQTDAGPIAAPLQSTRVHMTVSGHVVRTRVAQTYHNPSGQWMDAVYRFPMPDGSAVDGLTMTAGDRVIRGEIKAREAARRSFERAKAQGKRASLIAQTRPNDFNARVSNIEPNGAIRIEIEYQQVLTLGPDGWALRFPTVVAPKYYGATAMPSQLVKTAYAMQDDDLLGRTPGPGPDPDRAAPQTSPVMTNNGSEKSSAEITPGEIVNTLNASQNRIQIDIQIDAGIPVTVPRSLTHAVSVETIDENAGVYKVQLATADIANRDFELQWEPQPGNATSASVQFEQFDGQWYGLALVAAPDPTLTTPLHQPREVIFVIDTSGSMHGDSIDQAVQALHAGLRRLNPKDRFNIIRFSSTHEALFNHSQLAGPARLKRAGDFLDSLQADGGTEMAGALQRALEPGIPAGFISQVVFITDGAVGTEQALFNMIESMLGNRRLFTVGIGSAPNDYFMKKAASAGRGSFTTISSTKQVQRRMTRLFEQLAYPMLTDLTLRDVNGDLLQTDSPIRDLYAGEPVIHSFRANKKPAALFLEGRRGNTPWQQEIRLVDTSDSGIHRLWARDALDDFGARIRQADLTAEQRDALRRGATDLALKHGLVSRYTSLVAVDHTPARPVGASSQHGEIPRHLPKGWSAKHTLGSNQSGQLATGSTGVWLQLLTGALLLLLALGFGAAFLMQAEKLLSGEQG